MSPIEALELTLDKVEELKAVCSRVEIKPYKQTGKTKHLIEKYAEIITIPPERWCNISFFIDNKEASTAIYEAANYLGMFGIVFDSGGASGERNWELDWSFHVEESENNDVRDKRAQVEDLLQEE